jgi:hypothetical protein
VHIRKGRGLVLVAGLVSAVPALAQQTGLAKDPPITMEAARKVALARVPGGKIQHEELEREHGRLRYSFEVSTPGQRKAQEVLVSAEDGSVVSVAPDDDHLQQEGEHEDKAEHGEGKSERGH